MPTQSDTLNRLVQRAWDFGAYVMPVAIRSYHHVLALMLATIGLSGTSVIGDDDFAELIADYAAYGLPMPSERSELVVLKWSRGTYNGVPQYDHALAFVEPTTADGDRTYWDGFHRRDLPDNFSITQTNPDADAIAAIEFWQEDQAIEFPTIREFALSVQCASRGWEDRARVLIKNAREVPFYRRFQGTSDTGKTGHLSDRSVLAALAWNYGCESFCRQKGDRTAIISRMARLSGGRHRLDTIAHQNILQDMRATLAGSRSPPRSAAALIDSLIDIGDRGGYRGELPGANSVNAYESYRKLQTLGLSAVPELLKHANDFRMTRCVESNHRGIWIMRIADVVHSLLNELANEEFAYDYLLRKGRGRCIDQAHVMHWWSQAKKIDARQYLNEMAIRDDGQGRRTVNQAILATLGREYPKDLAALFEANVEQLKYSDPLFDGLESANLPESEQDRLYLKAAKSSRDRTRESAIERLLKSDHSASVGLLIAELDRLPETPKDPYWHCSAPRIARLLCYTDNDSAWEALLRNTKRVDVGQRLEILQSIAGRSRTRSAAFLKEFLSDENVRSQTDPSSVMGPDDTGDDVESFGGFDDLFGGNLFSGPSAGFTLGTFRVGDFAAWQLAITLNIPCNPNASWKANDWQSLRNQVDQEFKRRQE